MNDVGVDGNEGHDGHNGERTAGKKDPFLLMQLVSLILFHTNKIKSNT